MMKRSINILALVAILTAGNFSIQAMQSNTSSKDTQKIQCYDTNQALFNAIDNDNLADVIVAIANKADVDAAKNFFNDTPLYCTLIYNKNNSISIVKVLLAANANVDTRASGDRIALHAATINNIEECAGLLIAQDPTTVNAKDKFGMTPMHYAACNDCVDVAKLLLENKAANNVQDNEGLTPLAMASNNNSNKVACLLIAHDTAIVNTPDKKKVTPLHRAARCGNCNIAKLLLSNSATINAQDAELGMTPLHEAARFSRKDQQSPQQTKIVQLLLAHNADITIKNNNGDFPHTCASIWAKYHIEEYAKAHNIPKEKYRKP